MMGSFCSWPVLLILQSTCVPKSFLQSNRSHSSYSWIIKQCQLHALTKSAYHNMVGNDQDRRCYVYFRFHKGWSLVLTSSLCVCKSGSAQTCHPILPCAQHFQPCFTPSAAAPPPSYLLFLPFRLPPLDDPSQWAVDVQVWLYPQ